jgi:lipopolysaccharide transport system permease protein
MLPPNLRSAWRYRSFIASSIVSEFRSRFARSRLGALWMIIHPLAQAAIFALVLAEIMGAKLPGMAANRLAYPIYLLSGLLAWSLFAEVVNRCLTLFIDNRSLLKKLQFPRITLPLIVAGTALVNNLLLLAAILVLFGVLGHAPPMEVLWLPLLIGLTLSLALGVGLLLGVFNVFARDVGQVVPVVMQLAFWIAPIAYTPNVVPAALRPILYLNPMTPVVEAYQRALLFGGSPDWQLLGILAAASALLLSFALMLFRRASPDMADVL